MVRFGRRVNSMHFLCVRGGVAWPVCWSLVKAGDVEQENVIFLRRQRVYVDSGDDAILNTRWTLTDKVLP